jgi:hypothetical protein
MIQRIKTAIFLGAKIKGDCAGSSANFKEIMGKLEKTPRPFHLLPMKCLPFDHL